MAMIRYVASRIISSVITVLSATLVAFVLLRILPGNPVQLIVGRLATAQEVAVTTRTLGLNEPIPVQFVRYISDFVQGNWGYSYSVGQPVKTLIITRLPASLELGFYAFILAFGAAVTLALLSIRHPVADRIVRGFSFLGLGTPPFWLALLLLLLFSEHYHLIPGPEGRLSPNVAPPPPVTHFYTIDALIAGQYGTFLNAAWHLLLPAVTLGFADFAFLVRLLRTNLMEVSREPFIAVVRSKGLRRAKALRIHALPNAFLPTMTVGGLVLAELLAGSVLVETVFDWPGVGALVAQSIQRKDYSVVEIFILLSAVAYVVVNLIIDILYGVIDPRVRLQSAVAK
jgi:ABC-type dipeptide/oligopeptide/nickel transport system permease component